MANKDDVVQIVENRTRVVLVSGSSLTGMNDMLRSALDLEIDSAVRDYSMDEPRIILEDKTVADLVDVDNVKFFKLDKWDRDVSAAAEVEIEFPVDQARKQVLRRGYDLDFTIQERPTGGSGEREWWVKFYNAPAGQATDKWRLRYKTKYDGLAVDADLSELPKRAVELVGLLCSVYVARGLAGKYGKTVDPTMDADVVDYRSRSAEWRQLAEALFKEYENRIDRPSRVKRAGADIELIDNDLTIQGRRFGRDYLVHRRSRR